MNGINNNTNLLLVLPSAVLEYNIISADMLDEGDIKTLGLTSKALLKISNAVLTGNNAFNKRRCNRYEKEIQKKLADPKEISWIGRERIRLATQTLKIIIQSRLPDSKRYHCLVALSAALETCSEPEAFTYFRRIANADIPHFILTRCWEIDMRWDCGHHYAHPSYNPITQKALSALVQAQKNVLERLYDRDHIFSVTRILFTSKNYPILKKKEKIEEVDSAFLYFLDRSYARKLIDDNLGVANARALSSKERLNYTMQIRLAIKTRLIGEGKLRII